MKRGKRSFQLDHEQEYDQYELDNGGNSTGKDEITKLTTTGKEEIEKLADKKIDEIKKAAGGKPVKTMETISDQSLIYGIAWQEVEKTQFKLFKQPRGGK